MQVYVCKHGLKTDMRRTYVFPIGQGKPQREGEVDWLIGGCRNPSDRTKAAFSDEHSFCPAPSRALFASWFLYGSSRVVACCESFRIGGSGS